jgi:hypothetical protein
MKEVVLDIINSYQDRVSMVENMITTAYEANVASDESLALLGMERETLYVDLRERLVKNHSLRRKDFDVLMERILVDSEGKRGKIEQEWKLIRGKLKEYLGQQKELVASLREGLAKIGKEELAEDMLGVVIGDFRVTSQDRGEQILTLLRDFQFHLGVFLNEQREVNGELQRLVDIGESLRLEDLRCLEVARARQDRKMDRELRREDIERLLTHFRQQRQVNRRH